MRYGEGGEGEGGDMGGEVGDGADMERVWRVSER